MADAEFARVAVKTSIYVRGIVVVVLTHGLDKNSNEFVWISKLQIGELAKRRADASTASLVSSKFLASGECIDPNFRQNIDAFQDPQSHIV
jgi:hypothetical protein